MRYAVTGAAGFIGSHLAEALVAATATTSSGIDCLHGLLRPGAEGGERARARGAAPRPRRATSSTSRGFDGVFHLAGQPGVRSFGDVFDLYLRRNVLATPARVRGGRRAPASRVVFASSSSVYGEAERYPTPGGHRAAAALAVRDHEARLRAPRARLRAELRPRRRGAALLQRLRPAAAAGHGLHRASSTRSRRARLRAVRRRDAEPRLHVRRRRRRRRPIAAMERAPPGRPTTSAAASEATMLEAIAAASSELAGRTLDVPRARRCPATSGGRGPTRPASGRARLGADDVSFEDGLEAQWAWAAARVGAR